MEDDWSAIYPPDLSTLHTYQESMGVSGGSIKLFSNLRDVFFGGVLFRLPSSRRSPPEYNRVKLTSFI
jgi:hypothetical protein